jgi:hypothetical protein
MGTSHIRALTSFSIISHINDIFTATGSRNFTTLHSFYSIIDKKYKMKQIIFEYLDIVIICMKKENKIDLSLAECTKNTEFFILFLP